MESEHPLSLDRLDAHGGPFAPERLSARALLHLVEADAPRPKRARARRRKRPSRPRLAELALRPPRDVWDHLVGDDARRRVAALAQPPRAGAAHAAFGFELDSLRRALPFVSALYHLWFRVRSRGHAHVPSDGRAILVANQAGLLPFDTAMTIFDVLLHTDPPRLPRALVDRALERLPLVPSFFERMGQVIESRSRFAALLDADELVLVHPEGMRGITKRITQRYRLQPFRPGFVELALERGAPIVPAAIVGSEDQAPVLFDLPSIARRLGLPIFPLTPTFPWLGPLGLLPLPVRYRIVYGEPFTFHEQYGPDAARDERLVRYLAQRVRSRIQRLIDAER